MLGGLITIAIIIGIACGVRFILNVIDYAGEVHDRVQAEWLGGDERAGFGRLPLGGPGCQPGGLEHSSVFSRSGIPDAALGDWPNIPTIDQPRGD